jgi:ferric enterobactin receptor
MGFQGFEKIVALSQSELEMDLGNIKLQTDATLLTEVEIKSQKTGVQLGIDKKIFNVDKNITAAGGTAEDVLKNVPSVSITDDGAAQLRNKSTTVYVDGRPTVLTLNQISSEQIDQVEVITNPSAKFEASTTGGIINIVLKKNKKTGYNGSLSLGTGYPKRLNTMANINIKEGRFNWQASAMYMLNANSAKGYSNRTSLKNGLITDQFNQTSITGSSNIYTSGRLGTDYTVNNRNTFSLFSNVMRGQFNNADDQSFYETSATKDTAYYGNRNLISNTQFTNYGVQMMWRKIFPKRGRELGVDLTNNWRKVKNDGDWSTNNFYKNGTPYPANPSQQINNGKTNGSQTTFQLDYTNPVNDSTKWEMGVRSYYSSSDQLYLADSAFSNGTTRRIAAQSIDLAIRENVNAAYVTYTGRLRGIGYQMGLRYEQSIFDATSRLGGEGSFGYNYGSDLSRSLFPSLYISKKLTTNSEFQVNLSRKISRPDFRQIMPFIRQADSRSYSVGNPTLKPEFISLAEMNYNHLWKNNNWLFSIFFRHEDDPFEAYSELVTGDIIKNSFKNAKSNDEYGIDNTLKLGLSKNIEFTVNNNVFYKTLRTDTSKLTGVVWQGKATLNWKLSKEFSAQVIGNYESNEISLQGKRLSNGFMDFALKKDFGRTSSLTFAVNDLLDSRRRISYTETNYFIQQQMRRRDVRNFRLSYQYRFGKVDASLFNKKKPTRQQGQQDMDY